MGQKKHLRTKVRETKALTKAELQATKEWKERKSNIGFQLKEYLGDIARRIDPLEMVAVGGMTIIIYRALEDIPEVTERIGELLLIPASLGMFWAFVPAFFWKVFPEITNPKDIETPESLKWLMAFVVSFIIVRHPEVITEMFSGATKVSTFALGLLK